MGRREIIGKIGEDKACDYLENNGYVILERNYRIRSGEIDIIAEKDSVLHFIEVKTRKGLGFGLPSESVTAKKRRHILKVAGYYLLCNREYAKMQFRMDVRELLISDENYYIRHIENAFGEGEV